jgi:hypothetical protein
MTQSDARSQDGLVRLPSQSRPEPSGPDARRQTPVTEGAAVNEDLTPLRADRPRRAMLLRALPVTAAFVALSGGPLAATAMDAAAAQHGMSNGTPHTAIIVAGGDPCHEPALFAPMKIPDCAGD